jgi:hypothetical protein
MANWKVKILKFKLGQLIKHKHINSNMQQQFIEYAYQFGTSPNKRRTILPKAKQIQG